MSKASEKLKAMADERGLTSVPVERKVVQLGKTYKVAEQRPARRLGQAIMGQRMLRVVCSSAEEEMQQVLIDLEVASNGTTTNFDTSGGGVFGSKVPISGGCDLKTDPPHIHWRRRWEEAEDDDAKTAVLDGARTELGRLRKAPPPRPGETEEQRDDRLVKDGEGWTVRDVANTFKVTPTMVRRIRVRRGRDPERGMIDPMAPMPNASVEERRERALILWRDHKMSYRLIAPLFGVSHETIRKDVIAAMASERGRGARAA